jgi:hypothetical protein
MQQRGRKSAAALATSIAKPKVIKGGFGQPRPEPPEGMPEAQKKIWRDSIAGEPADFFATAATQALLTNYCRHLNAANEFSELIDDFPPEVLETAVGMRRLEWLMKMRQRETKAAMELATKLRLTNTQRWRPDTAVTVKDHETGPVPWEE